MSQSKRSLPRTATMSGASVARKLDAAIRGGKRAKAWPSPKCLRAAIALGAGLALGATVLSTGAALAKEPAVFTGLVKGVAVGGFDPVAYFTEGKPVAGKAEITLLHEGATWRFATEANRDAFKADPAKYAPQYGGYCAFAVAQGSTAKGDPNVWSIVNGKLYLNYNKGVQKDWEKNKASFITKADAKWPTVLGK